MKIDLKSPASLSWAHSPTRTGITTGNLRNFSTLAEAIRWLMTEATQKQRDGVTIRAGGDEVNFSEAEAAYRSPDFPKV